MNNTSEDKTQKKIVTMERHIEIVSKGDHVLFWWVMSVKSIWHVLIILCCLRYLGWV